MVKPKDPKEMQRPRRRFGDVIRQLVGCPLCQAGPGSGMAPLRVVAYRQSSIRLECPGCALRFSVEPQNLIDAINSHAFGAAMANVVYTRHQEPLTEERH